MSIEAERWQAVGAAVMRDRKVILRADTPGPYADDIALAQRVSVLPEALALLKNIETTLEYDDPLRLTMVNILQRAGVLGA